MEGSTAIFLLSLLALLGSTHGNKYSKEMNQPQESENLKTLNRPFRMAKINLAWEKAVKKLSEAKLKKLMTEFMQQDKEELTWKKMKADGGDKDGLKEAELRKKLRGIMSRYHLLEHFEESVTPEGGVKERMFNDVSDDKILKAIFKDKKLNKLWQKAESAGFTDEELKALKEEFGHHQEKVDQYNQLLGEHSAKAEQEMNDLENSIHRFDDLERVESNNIAGDSVNTIREKSKDIKDGYMRLQKISSSGPHSKEFVEPKVSGLWKMALRSDFTDAELESLHTELKHYEQRLLKVRYMEGELNVMHTRHGKPHNVVEADVMEKQASTSGQQVIKDKLKKQMRKVEKLHEDLENRILQRHLEL